MNQTIQELFNRKSVRAYKDIDITSQENDLILKAALQAPTAGNMALFSIIEIKNQDVKNRLAQLCDHQPFISKAPFVLLFLADYQRWYDMFKEYHSDIPQLADADLILAMEDTMIAAQNAVVAAESLGIGSCYIGDILENYEEIQEMFALPKYAVPTTLLVFGKPTEQQKERLKPKHFEVEDVYSVDTYKHLGIDETKKLFMKHLNKDEEGVHKFIDALVKRKINAEFHQEMNRSVKKIIEEWNK